MIETPMMLLLSGEEANDEAYMRFAVEDIAKTGFDAICLEFRDSRYDERDKIGRKAIRFVCDMAKKNGMGFVIIMPHCAKWILEKHPFLRRKICREHSLSVRESRGEIPLIVPEGCTAEKVIAAFRVERSQSGNIVRAVNIVAEAKFSFEKGVLCIGNCPDGEILAYVQYVTDSADYAHEEAKRILDEYLEIYKDYPLDGFALDEFGAGTRLPECYLCGEDFLNKFRKTYGYDFSEKLYLMNHRADGESFAKVRFDYYKMTNEITLSYQMLARKRYEEQFGKNLFIGFHHTWFGEGNSGDLWSGAIDYFRLSRALSGGFVDAQYDAERTMTSLGLIAESVAKYSSTGVAYNMCWDRFTTPEKMDYFHRLLAVRNIRWIGHAYSRELSRRYRLQSFIWNIGALKDTWGDVERCIRREKAFGRFLGNLQSRPKVAITYNWASVAYFNDDYMHYHRLSLKALADKLMRDNIPVDIVPGYETDFRQYEVIFVLWPTMMEKEHWEAVKRVIEEGRKVYFIGPPARVTTDGTDISRDFEKIVGAEIKENGEFMGGYEYVAWDLWFTEQRIHMRTYMDENRRMDFRNGNVKYYGYELPLTDMFFDVAEELKIYRTINSDRVISKEYYGDGECAMTVTARWQSRIEEKFRFAEKEIEIRNGLTVGIRFRNGEVFVISDPGAEIRIDGKVVAYQTI